MPRTNKTQARFSLVAIISLVVVALISIAVLVNAFVLPFFFVNKIFSSIGGAQPQSVSVLVVDSNNNAIPGAGVSIFNGTTSVIGYTNAAGIFAYYPQSISNSYSITASKIGYSPQYATQQGAFFASGNTLTITMKQGLVPLNAFNAPSGLAACQTMSGQSNSTSIDALTKITLVFNCGLYQLTGIDPNQFSLAQKVALVFGLVVVVIAVTMLGFVGRGRGGQQPPPQVVIMQ